MKIRYTTPTGCLCTTEIPAPENELQDWQIKSYVRKELQKRYIEFKSFKVL